MLDGAPYCFVGANSYFLHYAAEDVVRSVLDGAVRSGFSVLRVWAFLDRGATTGPSPPSLHPSSTEHGVWFQAFDAGSARVVFNDGPSGLEHLDFLLDEAKKRDLRLILTLTNNWRDFGGMDQYLAWHGLARHDQFFTSAPVRASYRAWLQHLTSRTNTKSGVPYKDDPTIFAWELANEPRTTNHTSFDSGATTATEPLTRWAEEMSAYLRAIDPNHLIAVGDEGFLSGGAKAWGFEDTPPSTWLYEAPYGVDSVALSNLPAVDFSTFHFYPGNYLLTEEDELPWLDAHLELARRSGKPSLLEEYGMKVTRSDPRGPVTGRGERRARAYRLWNETWLGGGGGGALAWMLTGHANTGQRLPDFDGYSFVAGDETASLLGGFAARARRMGVCGGAPISGQSGAPDGSAPHSSESASGSPRSAFVTVSRLEAMAPPP